MAREILAFEAQMFTLSAEGDTATLELVISSGIVDWLEHFALPRATAETLAADRTRLLVLAAISHDARQNRRPLDVAALAGRLAATDADGLRTIADAADRLSNGGVSQYVCVARGLSKREADWRERWLLP